jgi:hypothetical protein
MTYFLMFAAFLAGGFLGVVCMAILFMARSDD